MNDYEIGLEDRETGKRWAGENYGWQSQKSFEELYVQGKLNPAQQQIERITSSVTRAVTADPILGPTIKAVGGGLKTVFSALPQPIQQTIAKGVELQQTAAENIAAATGLPVSVTDPFTIADIATGGAAVLGCKSVRQAVKGAAKDLMPPPGPPMQPAMAMAGGTPSIRNRGGGVGLDFTSPQVMPITVEPRLRAPGMVQDVAQQPEFRGALDRRKQALEEVQENIARREAQGKTAAKYKKELAGKGSTLDYDPNDPIVFEKARYKVYDPLDPERTAHQHHLFAKAQSYPFVEKMEELIAAGIADEDDLVNMFAWADMLDVTMGNTRKNMLDAPGRAHIAAAPGSTDFDKSRNIHALLKEFDLEIPAKKVKEKVKDAQNATELMDIFNDYIVESVKPQKRVAQRIVEDFITRHRATLPKDQLTMFDDLASKLGGRYKPD